MKSIAYLIIIILLGSLSASAVTGSGTGPAHKITLQCVEAHPDASMLNASCAIIKSRLKDYGLQHVDVTIMKDARRIKITYRDDVKPNSLTPLLTARGNIAFYETGVRKDVLTLLNKEDRLFSLLQIPSSAWDTELPPSVLGDCTAQQRTKVDDYLTHQSNLSGHEISFMWSAAPDEKGMYRLFILKSEAAMDYKAISSSSVAWDEHSNNPQLMINFDASGTAKWQDITRRNIWKQVAIVLDDKVLSAPTVMEEIKEGKCLITGNFAVGKLEQLNALIRNPGLPLSFEVK